jgi:glucose-6-phosphate dehydrogenase assembly protein OpcA
VENAVNVPATAATPARTATVVVVGPADRLMEAAQVLGSGREAGARRVVLIGTEPGPAPRIEAQPDLVSIDAVRPEYIDNAIAAVRLSSLPTVIWWRGGGPEQLDAVAALAERVLLDALDPWPLWRKAQTLVEHTAFTDIRWTRLTRWRASMAHFFDLRQVRDAAPGISKLRLTGSDRAQCALFAGWLDASLGWKGRIRPELVRADGPPLTHVALSGERGALTLRLLPNGICLETRAELDGQVLAASVMSLSDQRLPALLSEELRVRSRDLAFEQALAGALSQRAP